VEVEISTQQFNGVILNPCGHFDRVDRCYRIIQGDLISYLLVIWFILPGKVRFPTSCPGDAPSLRPSRAAGEIAGAVKQSILKRESRF